MNWFLLPNWVIYLSVALNLLLLYVCTLYGDVQGIILCVSCIFCFIITYRINERVRSEEKDKKQGD